MFKHHEWVRWIAFPVAGAIAMAVLLPCLSDPETGRMVRAGGQKTVVATFQHDTSRNLDPLLHTHSVIANMLQGEDGKWRTMANERLYRRIASPEMLPCPEVLPHLKCSPGRTLGEHFNEESEHDGTRRAG